jgi:hypothetical protein
MEPFGIGGSRPFALVLRRLGIATAGRVDGQVAGGFNTRRREIGVHRVKVPWVRDDGFDDSPSSDEVVQGASAAPKVSYLLSARTKVRP